MIYEIKDLTGMAKGLGKQVAKENGFSKKELYSFIKVANIRSIIKQHSQRKKKKFFIDDKNIHKAYDDVYNWILGVGLAKMAANDDVECYWNSEKNCMCFSQKGEINDDLA